MKKHWLFSAGLLLTGSLFATAAEPKTAIEGLKMPESVCVGPAGKWYVTEIGEFGKDGDGKVSIIEDGKATTFVDGLDDPKGIVFFKDSFYLTDKTKVVKIDASGKKSVLAAADKFPVAPIFLNDIAIDGPNGIILISDSGADGKGGAVFRLDIRQDKIDVVASEENIPGLNKPNGVTFDGGGSFIVADMGKGELHRVRLSDKSAEKIADGLEGADGLAWDYNGRLFITSWTTGKAFGIPRPGEKPVFLGKLEQNAADSCVDASGTQLLIPDMKSGKLITLSTTIPGWEVDESPLAIEAKPAFPGIKWEGWDDGSESGKAVPFRPILLTHFGDGSGRIVVGEQHGVIYVIDPKNPTEGKIFLDLQDRVKYSDKQNEEGFLGLAFHPKFKENGEFFIFYTEKKTNLVNVVSKFKTKAGNKNAGDPASEVELIRFEKPFWNHDGGTIAFGPDGYLYITHGDGGAGGDPHENGQKMSTLLGKILRIDVDKPSAGKPYGIPADNPFVKQEGAKPEIYAYGFRNIWRFAFDEKTGQLWAGEVGQNLFEEIVRVTKGGNFGWSLRESLHPFGAKGVGVQKDMIEPIWEYHHDIGKSITGGDVYRGKAVPALEGHYVYADYVSSRFWALKYDEEKGRVVANRELPKAPVAVMSFGEDEAGELYLMGTSATGQGIFKLVKGK
ncbi:Quinoprotein glucose dehydrogenase B precursor [Anatilimnocola aggregata]|uniref:Quinoprotein glucose dehydrogenase B n=1 Tax=Anatilimnocola aggregata TaxID=2528021 RepID=A0A517Y4Y9_9BACT|nr:PQQ-dependent sugar dehydrogenase [Anatilimnocola aggregata]QDU25266.1 Quinoprotein glucose dehydrogenase B precursor [Anatilimnocola aggregata]